MRYPQILAAALLGAATVFAVPAAAQSSVAVKYADLDLTTSAGQARLERRIDKAVREVCGMDQTNVGTRLPSDEAEQCYNETKVRIQAQVATMVARGNGRG